MQGEVNMSGTKQWQLTTNHKFSEKVHRFDISFPYNTFRECVSSADNKLKQGTKPTKNVSVPFCNLITSEAGVGLGVRWSSLCRPPFPGFTGPPCSNVTYMYLLEEGVGGFSFHKKSIWHPQDNVSVFLLCCNKPSFTSTDRQCSGFSVCQH